MLIGLIAALVAAAAAAGPGRAELMDSTLGNKNKYQKATVDSFKNKAKEQGIDWLGNLSDTEILSMMETDGYRNDVSWFDDMFNNQYEHQGSYDIEGFMKKAQEIDQGLGGLEGSDLTDIVPPDASDIQQQATDLISEDNEAYSSEMDEIINGVQNNYEGYRDSVLGQNYANQNSIMNNMNNQFKQSRQTAIEAGASAGVKLANNVNVLLSNQNSQRAASLETANTLASQLMNQQQQALSYRAQEASHNSDTALRTNNTYNSLWDTKNSQYEQQRGLRDTQVSDLFSGVGSGETMKGYATTYAKNKATKGIAANKYGGE